MRLFAFNIIICLLLTVCTARGQIKFSVIPSKMVIQQNEIIELQFVVEGTSEITQFTPPVFRNFEVVSGMSRLNGVLSDYVSYSFMLRPTTKGMLPIASAIVKVKGKTYTTRPIIIEVTNATAASPVPGGTAKEEKPDYYLKPGDNINDKISENLFVKLTVDKKSCYVGEPLLATFQLFTRLESESKILKRPSLNGFSVIDIEEPEAGLHSKEKVNGKIFNCYLIRKVQLFPLQAGLLSIEPMEVENLVQFRFVKAVSSTNNENKNRVDTITDKMRKAKITSGDYFKEKVILQTEEVDIKVLELPKKDKPQNFDGAVGNLSITASLIKKEIASNENGNLRITISGAGNVSMIPTPNVQWPAGLESFGAKTTEELDKTGTTLQGVKTFDIPFTAAAPGVYQIPAVQFSYFDYKSRKYKSVRSDSLQIKVNNQLAAVTKPTAEYLAPEQDPLFDKELMWKLAGAFMLLFAAAIIIFIAGRSKRTKKKQPTVVQEEPVVIKKTAGEFLSAALFVKEGRDDKKFCSYLLRGTAEFMTDRLHTGTGGNNHDQQLAALKQKGMYEEALRLQQLAELCEQVMFSPFEIPVNRDELIWNAEDLMKKVDGKV